MRSFFYEQPWGLLSAAVLAVLYLLAALPLLWALQLENYRPRKMLPAVRRISRATCPPFWACPSSARGFCCCRSTGSGPPSSACWPDTSAC